MDLLSWTSLCGLEGENLKRWTLEGTGKRELVYKKLFVESKSECLYSSRDGGTSVSLYADQMPATSQQASSLKDSPYIHIYSYGKTKTDAQNAE